MTAFCWSGIQTCCGQEKPNAPGAGLFVDFVSYPGAREWWHQSGMQIRWPTHLVKAIETVVAEAEAKVS